MGILTELKRKAVHLTASLIPVLYFIIPGMNLSLILLLFITLIFLAVDLSRLQHPTLKEIFMRYFGSLIREHEKKGAFLGSTHFLAASLISIYLFTDESITTFYFSFFGNTQDVVVFAGLLDKRIAVVVLLFLVLGDTFAAIVGKAFGRVRIFNKTIEGSLACFVVCFIIAYIFQFNYLVCFIGALTATLVELLPIPLDDNLRIPLVSGLVMELIS